MKNTARLFLGLIVVFLIGWSSALAQDECAPPDGAVAARATALFQRAQRVLDEGNSQEAVQLLQEVLQLHESPNVRLILARALTLDGRLVEAWDSYRRAEEHASRCGDRYAQAGASALQERAGVARQIGLLRVVVPGNDNASVEVRDGGAIPRTVRSGELLPVRPGLVEVKVTSNGFEEWREVVTLAEGTTRELEARLRSTVPTPAQAAAQTVVRTAPSTSVPPLDAPRERTGWRAAALGVGALAVASAVVAVIGFVQAGSIYSDAEGQCTPTACPGTAEFSSLLDQGQTWERVGVGLAITTGVLAITSIGLGVAAIKNPYVTQSGGP